MSRFLKFLQETYDTRSTQVAQRENALKKGLVAALERHQPDAATEAQLQFVDSVTKKKRATSVRVASRFMTERDAEYCGCGHLKKSHCRGILDGCACQRMFTDQGVEE